MAPKLASRSMNIEDLQWEAVSLYTRRSLGP